MIFEPHSRRSFLSIGGLVVSSLLVRSSAPGDEAPPALKFEPADPPAFKHARVIDAWEVYRDKITFGKGQTLALLDDGCKLSMPEWSQSDGEVPKVLVSYDSVDGDDDPKHEGAATTDRRSASHPP